MALPFLAVETPDFAPARGGILSVANVIEGDRRVAMGVSYPSNGLCGQVSRVPEDCWVVGPDEDKTFDGFEDVTAEPFGVYKGIECWLDGSDDYTATATKALEAGESFGVAQALVELILDAAPAITGGTVEPVQALAAAEQYASEQYGGQATIHVSRYGATILANLGLLVRNLDGSLETWLGSKVSADGGYETGYGATFTIWVTGQVNLWRAPVIVTAAQNRGLNKGRALAERLYTATVDCFTGQILAAAASTSNYEETP